jgi:hypothetical protein
MTRIFRTEKFDVVDVFSAGLSGKNYRLASVDVRISGTHEDLLFAALGRPSWRNVSLIWSPNEGSQADQQVTLQVRMPTLARWSTARRLAAINRRVLSKLDQAGIAYTIVQVETCGMAYIPKRADQPFNLN